MMVMSAAMQVMSQQQQASNAKKAANYQNAVAQNNAILAERQATDARARGELAERRQAIQTQQLEGRQRAALAANGVVVDTGSALDITSDTRAYGTLDQLTVRNNAEREALGFSTQAMNYSAEGDMALFRGKAAAAEANTKSAGTIIGAAGSVAGKWSDFNNAGINVLS